MNDIKKFRYINNFLNTLSEIEETNPHLCDFIVDKETSWDKLEQLMKGKAEPPFYAENILLENFASAMNAYKLGRRNQALKELAKCGAVTMRMMEKIENEMEE